MHAPERTLSGEPPPPLASFYRSPGSDLGIVAKASALRNFVRGYAAQGDEDRQSAPEVMDKLRTEGLLHIAVPKRLGGLGGNTITLVDTIAEIARGDAGHAWAANLINVSNWMVTLFSDQAQKDVFGENPRARVATVFNPAKKSEKVKGGVRISGDWWYGSGSGYADWLQLGLMVEGKDGAEELALGLIRRSDVTIKDTWNVAGMRASGSNTIIAENIFVPSHRIQTFRQLLAEDYQRPETDEPMSWASFLPAGIALLASPSLGAARSVIDLTLQYGAEKLVLYTAFDKSKKSPVHQILFAQAVSEVDQAYLMLARACADIDAAALDRRKLDNVTRARVRMDTGVSLRLCREAINKLLSFNGSGCFATSNHIQRAWRDAEVGSRHGFLTPEFGCLIYGRQLLGIDEWVQDF